MKTDASNTISDLLQDPTNLNTKLQKHQNFEAELDANKNRIVTIKQTGQDLIDNENFQSPAIAERLEEIDNLWATLLAQTEKKGKSIVRNHVCIFWLYFDP